MNVIVWQSFFNVFQFQEVERLEDNLMVGRGKETKKSDIIERITESRRQRHKNALEDLHEELGHLNKAVDPQV